MQYPPRESENQPYYAPSEIYQHEQSQAYEPVSEIARSPVQSQEIIVYANRGQAIMRTAICVVCLLVMILIVPAFIILGAQTGSPFEASDLVSLVVVIPAIIFVGWLTWRTASAMLLNRAPILVINREGITVRRIPSLSGFVITWSEIGALSISASLYKYLCIAPRNPDEYLKRFNGFERLLRRSNMILGIPALIIPQIYLDKPVEEILQQVYYIYANELSYYRVQFRL